MIPPCVWGIVVKLRGHEMYSAVIPNPVSGQDSSFKFLVLCFEVLGLLSFWLHVTSKSLIIEWESQIDSTMLKFSNNITFPFSQP